jgi:aspartyl-tRNA synthetase
MCTEMEGKIISFRARIHTLRRMSAKLVFILFRQQTMTVQGVLQSSKHHEDLQRMQVPRSSVFS